jgi:putative addiction module killer protein
MIELVQYETESGTCPFSDWFDELENPAASKVRTALARIETGNFGDTKSVGSGVFERRIDFGPG